MTKTDTNIPELVINTLTNAEYEAAKQAGEISSTELYMTTDDPDYITEDQLENKQDLLISGTNIKTINNQSLLGSGNIDIQGGGSSTAEEIINANEATGATSPLKVWQGTEQEYNQGEIAEWKNWKTDTIISSTNSSLPGSETRIKAFGDGKFLAIGNNNGIILYSSTDAITWSAGVKIPNIGNPYGSRIAYGLDKFIIIYVSTSNYYYSSDGETVTAATFPITLGDAVEIAYGNNTFVIINRSSTTYLYSSDGINWTTGTLPTVGNNYWYSLNYLNNRFIACVATGDYIYSTDGIHWSNSFSSGRNNCTGLGYGDGKYIIAGGSGTYPSNSFVYSYDCETWTTGTLPVSVSDPKIAFDGTFFVMSSTVQTSSILISSDGITWEEKQNILQNNTHQANIVLYGNNNFVLGTYSTYGAVVYSSVVTIADYTCYTLNQVPTTSSTVYSAPSTESTLTITAVDTTNNTITLSDNNVYNRNIVEDTETYRSIGEIHPDYICNINNVGVKIGNITIADNTTLDTVPTQGSTNAITSGAVYEVLGNLETALYNFNSRTE